MALRSRKDQKLSRKDFSRILGRIHISAAEQNPETGISPPFLLVKDGTKRVFLKPVIAAILSSPSASDNEIVARVGEHGLCPSDVVMVRAYLHRFGPDVDAPLPLPPEGKILLLDENIQPDAMLSLSRAFGWATHVQAEGLAGLNTVDELIWDFAQDNEIAGLVTRDSDFLGIHKRRFPEAHIANQAAPRLIFLECTTNTSHLTSLFALHASAIRRMLESARPGCVLKSDDSCQLMR